MNVLNLSSRQVHMLTSALFCLVNQSQSQSTVDCGILFFCFGSPAMMDRIEAKWSTEK